MNKKKMMTSLIISLSLIIIVASVVNLSLNYQSEQEEILLSPTLTRCVDSDNTNARDTSDLSSFSASDVNYRNKIYKDLKISSKRIREYYCINNRLASKIITCSNGIYQDKDKKASCYIQYDKVKDIKVKAIKQDEVGGIFGTGLLNGKEVSFKTYKDQFKGIKIDNCNINLPEDIDNSGDVDAVDVQLVINGALGLQTGVCLDVDSNGEVDAIDVQKVVNGALMVNSNKGRILLIVKNSLLPQLQSDLDIWKQDVKNEYSYEIIQKSISTETPQNIKDFIKSQYNHGNLRGVLFVGNIPTSYSDQCLGGLCPSDFYYNDLNNNCFSIPRTTNRCNSHNCNEIIYYTPIDQIKCFDFIDRVPNFWTARLTTPNNNGNDIAVLSSYFKRNHDYRTGKISYDHKMLAYLPILDSDFSIEEDKIIRQWFLNQGSEFEKLNFYSGEVNLISRSDPIEYGLVSDVYSEELKKPYEYVFYNGHGSQITQQVMVSDELITIKPKPLFYLFASCSVGDFTYEDYLAGNYLFDGEGLAVIAATVPVLGTPDFPEISSFLLDNCFNFGFVFTYIYESSISLHFFGDPTLKLTKTTNFDIEIESIDLGIIQIPKNQNDFYYKDFNIVIKNLGNEKINVLVGNVELITEPTDVNIDQYFQFDPTIAFSISIEPWQEKAFPSKLLVHGSFQPVKFKSNYLYYSNAKNSVDQFNITGEFVS